MKRRTLGTKRPRYDELNELIFHIPIYGIYVYKSQKPAEATATFCRKINSGLGHACLTLQQIDYHNRAHSRGLWSANFYWLREATC
eukprot:1147252-Pelagomonas_calceolata.AAC.2